MRTTILLGAGAMCECTSITTKYLTEQVVKKKQTYFDRISNEHKEYPLLAEIEKDLSSFFHKDEYVSFEDIFHTLEMIDSYKTSCRPQTVKEFKSVFPIFTNLCEAYQEKMEHAHTAKRDLVKVIIDEIHKHEGGLLKKDNQWFSEFFRNLGEHSDLDIFSLNYDTWLEQIFEGQYNDGYEAFDESYNVFSAPKVFEKTEGIHSINHLHGQICFTSKHPKLRRKYVWDNQSLNKVNNVDILHYDNLLSFPLGEMQTTQAGEQIYLFPIITGLRKTEKINYQPFDAYFHHFYQSIMNNERLLIIGYGFGDLYINSVLKQFYEMHGERSKVVIIDHLDPLGWSRFLCENRTTNTNFLNTCYHLFREKDLDFRNLGWEQPEYILSKDSNKSIFTMGFRNVAENHMAEIIDILFNAKE